MKYSVLILIPAICCLTFCSVVLNAQTVVPEHRLAMVRVVATDGVEWRGFLKEIDTVDASIHFKLADSGEEVRLGASQIERIAFFKRDNFGSSFGKGFLVGEGIWLTYVLTKEEGYFGRGFDLLAGTLVFVLPISTAVGILGGINSLSLDYPVNGDADLLLAPYSRLRRYNHGREVDFTVSEKRSRYLLKREFAEAPRPRHHPAYSPRFHAGLRYGYGLMTYGKRVVQHYGSLRQNTGFGNSHPNSDRVWTLQVGYSPTDRLEIGYGYQVEYGQFTDMAGTVSGYQVTLSSRIYQNIHKIRGLYHFKPVYRAVGSPLQLSAGGGLLFSNVFLMASATGASDDGEYFQYDEVSVNRVLPGLGLMGRASFFLNPNFSIDLNLEQYLFAKVTADPLELSQPVGFSGGSLSASPNLLAATFGIRYHL